MTLTSWRWQKFVRLGAWGLPALACLPCLAIGIGVAGVGLGLVLTVAIPVLGGALLATLAVVYARRWRNRPAD